MYSVSGVRLQSAALPYRIDRAGRPKILLVTSARAKRWTIPKGRAELHLTLAENAAKEALEEAGIVGAVASRSSGMYRAAKRVAGGVVTIEVRVYLMRVTGTLEDWPERRHRPPLVRSSLAAHAPERRSRPAAGPTYRPRRKMACP